MSMAMHVAAARTRPSFLCDFMRPGYLPPGLSYNNSSPLRTYFGSDGMLQSAATNEAVWEYDPFTLALHGMRWEMQARTNYILRSEFPDGVTNASPRGGAISATSLPTWLGRFTTGIAFAYDNVTDAFAYAGNAPASTLLTFSVFVKMDDGNPPVFGNATGHSAANDFALVIAGGSANPLGYTVKNCGGGIYRISASRTSGTNHLTNTGICKYATNSSRTFKATGYQLEAGGTVSSYIPTTGSTVQRQADILSTTDFAPWFNGIAGSIFFEGSAIGFNSSNGGICAISDGANLNRHYLYMSATGAFVAIVNFDGTAISTITTGNTITAGSIFKIAHAYGADNFGAALNGGTVGTDASGVLPIVDQLRFGATTAAGGLPYMGHARHFAYHPHRFIDAEIKRKCGL